MLLPVSALKKKNNKKSISGFLILIFPSSTHQWTQLKTRKQNLTRLFQKMQSYQFEQISADPDKPLADGIRPLDTTDMERYDFIALLSLLVKSRQEK